jgi:hypothetical protein
LEHLIFFHILGIIIPTDYIIFFSGLAQPPTSYFSLFHIHPMNVPFFARPYFLFAPGGGAAFAGAA